MNKENRHELEEYGKGCMITYILSVTTPRRVNQVKYTKIKCRSNDSANADNKVFVCDKCGSAWRWNLYSNKNRTPEYCENIPKYGKKHIDCPICTGKFKIKIKGENNVKSNAFDTTKGRQRNGGIGIYPL